jgi:hypothetical protein
MASQIGNRLVYQQATAALRRANINPGTAVLSQSYLRTEAALSTTSSAYQFNVTVQDTFQTAFNTQQLIGLQDAFVVSELGVFVCAPSSSTATDFRLDTYDSILVYTTANAANGIRTVYNGALSLTVNQRQIVTDWDLMRHYKVPTQQKATNAYYATTGPAFQDGNDMSTDSMFPVEPNWVIKGNAKNLLQITLPGAPAAIQANSRIVIIMRGLLAQNSTPLA